MPESKHADDFWQEFEASTGERVLARGIGQYVSGWQQFDESGEKSLWGLVIATSGGFRFHHFPKTGGLLGAFGTGGKTPKEKTLFIPASKIVSAVFHTETRWYKKLLSSDSPVLLIRYFDEKSGSEKELRLSSVHQPDGSGGSLAEALADFTSC